MPKHWSKMVMKDTDDKYLRLNYIKMNVVLWSAVQETLKEITHLKGEITKLKERGKAKVKTIARPRVRKAIKRKTNLINDKDQII